MKKEVPAVEEKAWEELNIREKLEALGFDDSGDFDKTLHEALDAFSDTLTVVEEIDALAKSAQADKAEAPNVVDQIAKLLGE
jgi:hypothetical protein